jgi:hypothetical protein
MPGLKVLSLSGIAAVVLIAVTFVVGGSNPDPDASAATVLSFYETHHGRQIAATFLLTASVPFLVFFAAALASTLWPQEPGARPVWELVLLAGGAVAGGAILLAAAVHFALADTPTQLSPSALKTLNVVDGDSWIAWNAGIGVMMLGAGGSLLSRAAGSRWLAWTAVLLGILLFVPFADFFALLASGLWILAASVAALRRSGLPAHAAGVAAVLAVMGAALVVVLPASAGGNAGSTQKMTFDPTGAVFTCPGTDYTVLGGELRLTLHDSTAADGSEHVSQTRVPLMVTLSDGTTSTIYRLAGANASGGNFHPDGQVEFTDITFFNILAPNHGVVARVAGVEHYNSVSGGFTFTFGACETPQEQ